MRDYADAQRPNGGFTETAPYVGIDDAGMGGDSGPIGWQSFMPIAQSWLLKYYGNLSVLADTYDSAAAYCSFLDASPAGPIENGLGDWMAVENKALALTGRGFQLMSYAAFANISAALGRAASAAKYAAAAEDIATLINSRFLNNATGVYADAAGGWNATQCGQALPLYLGIVPPNATEAAASVLEANVDAHHGLLQVGGFGMKWLLEALSANGRADAAFGIMTATDYPSFVRPITLLVCVSARYTFPLVPLPALILLQGYMLNGSANGLENATTVWESWFASDNT